MSQFRFVCFLNVHIRKLLSLYFKAIGFPFTWHYYFFFFFRSFNLSGNKVFGLQCDFCSFSEESSYSQQLDLINFLLLVKGNR